MTTKDDAASWAQHRRAVVATVFARVPGVDAEEAASRALVKMLCLADEGARFEQPLAYWRRAALHEAYSLARESGRTRPTDDDALAAQMPAAPDAPALQAERRADVEMLRRALDGLGASDRDLVWSRHVEDRSVARLAAELDLPPHTVTVRLARAEERLAAGFAAAHAALTDDAVCRATRGRMHGYVSGRLSPRRRRELEDHLGTCDGCARAFVDVREVSWGLKAIAPWLVAGTALQGAAALTGGSTGVVAGARWGRRAVTTTAAATAVVVLAGFAAARVLGPDDAPASAAVASVGPRGAEPSGAEPSGAEPSGAASAGAVSTGAPTRPASPTRGTETAPGTALPAARTGASAPTGATDGLSSGSEPTASSSVPRTTSPAPTSPAPAGAPAPAAAASPSAQPDPTPSTEPTTSPSTSTPAAPAPSTTPAPSATSATTAPARETVTVTLPVSGLRPGRYRVVPSADATVTGVVAHGSAAWVEPRGHGASWYVRVGYLGRSATVTVTLTGPPDATATLSAS